MELLALLGITGEAVYWLGGIVVMCFGMLFIKTECGRFYSYKDISGVTIVKDRETGKQYMKYDDNSNLIEITKDKDVK